MAQRGSSYDAVAARKDRAVDWLYSLDTDEGDDAADKLDDEAVEDFAERKHIVIIDANPGKKKATRKAAAKKSARTKPRKGAKVRTARGARRANLRRRPAARKNAARRVRGSSRKRNAFGLESFIGRKPRKTSRDWDRAGDKRRSRAVQRAGVSKKSAPAYSRLDWKDLQGLDSGFVSKVMKGLNPRMSPKARAAIGSKIRQLRREGMPQKAAVEAAFRQARSGYTKKGAYKRTARRNPQDERAGETYAMFHGRGPSETLEICEFGIDDPTNMAALGDLVSFNIGDKDFTYTLRWDGNDFPLLATDPNANQLYIVGGDQECEDLVRRLGVGSRDLVDLGNVKQVEYQTQKSFDNFKPIVYYHKFGEEDAKKNPRKVRRPRLLYSRRSKKLMLAGGGYKIKKDGIIN